MPLLRSAVAGPVPAALALLGACLIALPAAAPAALGTPVVTQDNPERSGPPSGGEEVLAVLDGATTQRIDPAVLQERLGPLLADPALGTDPGAIVIDAVTGDPLGDIRSSSALVPASSLKVLTGLAALSSLGPQTSLATRTVRDGDGAVVLIGGGDPTLLAVPAEDAPNEPDVADPAMSDAADLAELARLTAAALQGEGAAAVSLRYDATLFQGPALSPDWDPDFVGLGIISPVSALTLDPDSGGVDPAALDQDPAATAADAFAGQLRAAGIEVTTVSPGVAGNQAEPLAAVASPPMSALVDRLLDFSDNDVAEALFRLVALERGLPGSFDGGARAVADVLAEFGVGAPGLEVRDGSGLSRGNRVAPVTIAEVLRLTALLPSSEPSGPANPTAAPVEESAAVGLDERRATWLPPGLSVGGFTGTLAGRFDTADTEDGAGRVAAKTGTLTGVTSLSGVATTLQGRPVVFSIIGNETPNTLDARAALDRVAAEVVACGCAAEAS